MLIIGVCVITAWLAASVALAYDKAGVLPTGLASLLRADYSAEPEGPPVLPPLDVAIIESAIEDEQALLTPPEETGPVFVPIFIADEGNQAPPPPQPPPQSRSCP